MKRTHRIVLEDNLLPVQVFLNSVPDHEFLEILQEFSRGIGAGYDLADCVFPGDIPEGETPVKGIEFSLNNGQTVILTYGDFLEVLKKTCNVYLEDNENETKNVEQLLVQIEELLSNPDRPVLQPGYNSRG